MKGASDVLL